MAVLNVTPDSFSDGGLHFETRSAVDAGFRMRDEGADIIDVGGESTRPGADPVGDEEECARILPVISELATQGLSVSVDTSKASVARRALQVGAKAVNDVSGLRDPVMRDVCAEARCTVCIMHMQGEPRTMQRAPRYEDVVAEVLAQLIERAQAAETHGIHRNNIWIDPGIGFGKTADHNLKILGSLDRLVRTGYPVLVGVSRKSFIGKILAPESQPLPVGERLEGTLSEDHPRPRCTRVTARSRCRCGDAERSMSRPGGCVSAVRCHYGFGGIAASLETCPG
jgi:dihydropteroate synthase